MTDKYTPRQHAVTVNAIKLHEMLRMLHELTVDRDPGEYGITHDEREDIEARLKLLITDVGDVAAEILPEGEA